MATITSTPHLTTSTPPLPFALLRPGYHPARSPEFLYMGEHYPTIFSLLKKGGIVAIDFETRGTDATLEDNYVVGMGLASRDMRVYLHRIGNEREFDNFLFRALSLTQVKWIAHNVNFDGQWIFHKYEKHLNWYSCTYALYRHTATEGWPGQKWGLAEAELQLLNWKESNKMIVEEWLVENGYTTRPVPKHLLEKLQRK